MKKYFTISEFAGLRNININSLRYYEKIGLLKPAYTDPANNYRYYTPEQLSILDTIQLCILLDIPLKELNGYMDKDGFFQERALFEEGKRIAEQKISEIQTNLKKIEYSLWCLENTEPSPEKNVPYHRLIPERNLITAEYTGDLADIQNMEQFSFGLYTKAQERGLAPVIPSGLYLTYEADSLHYFFFFETASKDTIMPGSVVIPSGEFLCVQFEGTANVKALKKIAAHFDIKSYRHILIYNMLLDRFQFGSRQSEIQILLSKPSSE